MIRNLNIIDPLKTHIVDKLCFKKNDDKSQLCSLEAKLYYNK